MLIESGTASLFVVVNGKTEVTDSFVLTGGHTVVWGLRATAVEASQSLGRGCVGRLPKPSIHSHKCLGFHQTKAPMGLKPVSSISCTRNSSDLQTCEQYQTYGTRSLRIVFIHQTKLCACVRGLYTI